MFGPIYLIRPAVEANARIIMEASPFNMRLAMACTYKSSLQVITLWECGSTLSPLSS